MIHDFFQDLDADLSDVLMIQSLSLVMTAKLLAKKRGKTVEEVVKTAVELALEAAEKRDKPGN